MLIHHDYVSIEIMKKEMRRANAVWHDFLEVDINAPLLKLRL